MQDQLVCHGCRNMLMYPRGATIVRCALCNTINLVSHAPQGMEMAHIRSGCGHCGSVMMHTRGATSVRCSSCQILNLVAVPHNQTAHINCGHCRITLMYPYGAPSVKCSVCQFVTNVNMNNGRVSPLINRPNGTVTQPTMPSTSITTQTVVVENPMSVDESGKLVSNVVVGVTTHKK